MKNHNKVALITGAGQGIGLEIAKLLAEKGHHVIINDIEKSLTEDAVKEVLKTSNAKVLGLSGDSGDLEFIREMVGFAQKEFGNLNVVIANAGITLYGDFWEYDPKDFFEVLRVNMGGTFFLAQAAARVMKNQADGGSLLFTSSVTAHQAHKNLAAYGMSKAAIEMLAKNLVIELSEYKINVNTIAPGATLTKRTAMDKDYEKTWSRITPMGKPASVTDIAHAAVFLVTDEARHITGQNLVIDGGWTSISPSPY
ncbi:NAD(P)-dependent dehydrogenase, short-chain alcohol dehydrogenase family [Aquiflexum balticum DSM 16537]|uniref:NAD(P)-dependent dehydrogenase, short-chain alcohol dehydrogenase family n=1 Tax=Aquiflexum balticum DSM 16537 TaxID=758820 RepID=A0A1W2H3F3_9BACT|nr:SDR family oxidoreductase [Aquiflexum balticum]SMD43477.1 NAD(P)-dependent dehydrogenase, short-chain alcohol dehydrogenase family [Aquiflexum balticum DSM 16537]